VLIILVVEDLEHALKVGALLDRNSLQLIIASDSYAKVVADRAKICHLKFTIELPFNGVNGGPTADNLNVVYVD
jgi:hypothetical protein